MSEILAGADRLRGVVGRKTYIGEVSGGIRGDDISDGGYAVDGQNKRCC